MDLDNNNKYVPCWVDSKDNYTLWKGKWESSNFDTAFGTIEVPLQNNNIGTYEVDAVITYDGCYNSGKKVSFPIKITSTEIETLHKREVTYLEFTGSIGDQKIEYSISQYTPNRIIGIYKSYDPHDAGSIELKSSEDHRVDHKVQKGNSWCVIV